MLKVTVIGAGNMAWQLVNNGVKQQWKIEEIYSRNLKHAHQLSEEFSVGTPTNQLDFSGSAAQLFLLSVTDQAMEEVVQQLRLPTNAILAHTSGSQPLQLISQYFPNSGVFYPFQTVSKGKPIDFKAIPICIEATDSSILDLLRTAAQQLSTKVYELSSENRKKLHLAAIFACNFVNHLLSLSQEVLEEANMDFGLMEHLIRETIDKAFVLRPKQSQTGPAIRRDYNIISAHLTMLKGDEAKTEIYNLLTKSIEQMH